MVSHQQLSGACLFMPTPMTLTRQQPIAVLRSYSLLPTCVSCQHCGAPARISCLGVMEVTRGVVLTPPLLTLGLALLCHWVPHVGQRLQEIPTRAHLVTSR